MSKALPSQHDQVDTASPRRFELHTFDALRFRDFRLLWLGQFGTTMGHWMDQVTRAWLIYQLTHSPLDLGLLMAFRSVPFLVFSIIAGAVADRYGRKAQIIISQLANVVMFAILALLAASGRVEPWHIYLASFASGTVMTFQNPARMALVSDIVGEKHITNAVALNSTVQNVSRTVGPAVAGVLISVVGVPATFLVQGALYAYATVWTIQIAVPQSSQARRHSGVTIWQSMGEGLQYMWTNQTIRYVMLLALVPLLLAQPYTSMMPVFAEDVYAIGATGQGFLLTAAGIGALIGALGIATLGEIRRQGWALLAGSGLFGASLVGFAAARWLPLALVLLLIVGVASTAYGSLANAILQARSPAALRGRVMSVYLLEWGLVPLGSVSAGAMTSVVGAPWTVGLMGGACALLAVWMAVRVRTMREL